MDEAWPFLNRLTMPVRNSAALNQGNPAADLDGEKKELGVPNALRLFTIIVMSGPNLVNGEPQDHMYFIRKTDGSKPQHEASCASSDNSVYRGSEQCHADGFSQQRQACGNEIYQKYTSGAISRNMAISVFENHHLLGLFVGG